MTSAEPKITSTYSQDIALRVVWMKLKQGQTIANSQYPTLVTGNSPFWYMFIVDEDSLRTERSKSQESYQELSNPTKRVY